MAGIMGGGDEYPAFNPLGLLLGGRGYASSYYSGRANYQAMLAKEARDRREASEYANTIFASPELKTSQASPDDRMAQWALWNRMQNGPEAGRRLGSDLLTQSLGGIQQRGNIRLQAASAMAMEQFRTDEALREYSVKAELDAKRKELMIRDIMGPDAATGATGRERAMQDINRTLAAKDLGIPIKEGYTIGFDPASGEMYQTPQPGTPDYVKTLDKMAALSTLNQYGQDMLTMFDRGVGREEYNAKRQNMVSLVRSAEGLGTLDQGSADYVASILPDWWGDGPMYTQNNRQAREKLKQFVRLRELQLQQTQYATRIPLSGPVAGADIPPPPQISPRQARESLEQRREALPVPGPSEEEAQRPAFGTRGGWMGRRVR